MSINCLFYVLCCSLSQNWFTHKNVIEKLMPAEFLHFFQLCFNTKLSIWRTFSLIKALMFKTLWLLLPVGQRILKFIEIFWFLFKTWQLVLIETDCKLSCNSNLFLNFSYLIIVHSCRHIYSTVSNKYTISRG